MSKSRVRFKYLGRQGRNRITLGALNGVSLNHSRTMNDWRYLGGWNAHLAGLSKLGFFGHVGESPSICEVGRTVESCC
jgi:hypothetical protein